MKPKPTCEDCRDNGWLIFRDNTVQRCDQCQKFPGDLEAAIAFFRSGGRHLNQRYDLHEIQIRPRTK